MSQQGIARPSGEGASELAPMLITRYTQPGDTIADPMAGIGSVCYAAALQRHVIAREIKPCWLELLQQNASWVCVQAGLFAGSVDVGQACTREPQGYMVDHLLVRPPYGNAIRTTLTTHKHLP